MRMLIGNTNIDNDFNEEFEENVTTRSKDGKKIKEIHKKEVNQIIDNGKGKAKKLEEKIKEIKKDNK